MRARRFNNYTLFSGHFVQLLVLCWLVVNVFHWLAESSASELHLAFSAPMLAGGRGTGGHALNIGRNNRNPALTSR